MMHGVNCVVKLKWLPNIDNETRLSDQLLQVIWCDKCDL